MWFSYITRIILSAVLLALSIYQFWDGEIGNGIFILLLIILSIATIWFNEVMLMVFLAVRKGNFDKAEKRLDLIKKPELMINGQEAYYYLMRGMILIQKNQMSKSEGFFKKALNTGLYMDHDKAMAKLNLAAIAGAKRRKREALNWLAQAKKDDTKKMLTDQIKMIKQQMGRI
jgi:tetratricopeptide (TPR) repeat protein